MEVENQRKKGDNNMKRLTDELSKEKHERLPVENRQLFKEGVEQAQGVVEMWVEVLTDVEAREVQPKAIENVQADEDYELRIVIWKTNDIPIVDGGATDMYIRASYIDQGLEA